ncbi:MAG TPA: TraB/GumN family protein [Acidobacteriaceae bacterium]|jgi:hypothetical protein
MNRLARFAVAVGIVCGCGVVLGQQGAAAAPAQAKVWPPAAEANVAADPAIWRVKGAHGTVYLMGSVHIMKPNVKWESDKVLSALAASDVLYLEIANIDDAASAQPIVMQYGIDTAHPLSTKISKEDLALLEATAKAAGLPGEQMFEPMRPWLVSMTLSVVPMLKAGYQPTSGIDLKLLAEAKKEQKQVKGFETMLEQMHMLADVPEDEQVKMLHKDLAELDKSTAEMNDIVAAWEQGDVEKIGKMDNDELAMKYPEEYKRIVVDRNTKWAATIDGLLKDPATGTVFVAVGAAHLAGPDSVIKMLEKDGWKVERE